MSIIDKIQQENLEYICLENFMDVLDFALLDEKKGVNGFFLLQKLLDKGLRLSYTESGYVFDEQMAFKGDVKCALIRLEDKLFDTDEPKSKLYKDAIVKTQDGLETSLGGLLVKKSDVEKAYADYGETKFPWALTLWPQTDKEWDWFPVNQMDAGNSVSKSKDTTDGDVLGLEAFKHDESICKQPFFDWENRKHFRDFLTISEIVKIKYPNPETEAEKEDYVKKGALKDKRYELEEILFAVCRAGDLEYEGDFARMVDERPPYIVPTEGPTEGKFYITPPIPPKETQTYPRLISSTIKIHFSEFAKFVVNDKKKFPHGFWRELANWYDKGKAEVIENSDVVRVSQGKKEKNKKETRNVKRLRILTGWYSDLCKKHNNDRELIIKEIDRLTNEEIINGLKSCSADNEKYLWLSGAGRWIKDYGESVWQFKKTQGGKSNKI